MVSNLKNLTFLIVIVLFVPLLVDNLESDWMIFVAALILAIFFFSLVVRTNISFSGYYTSRWNILTNKYRHTKEFDFSRELLFPKLKEVLESSGFKIKYANKESGNILALSSISWYSWGENIYIHLEESNGKTKVEFISACLMQM